jgi:hypothetical protein
MTLVFPTIESRTPPSDIIMDLITALIIGIFIFGVIPITQHNRIVLPGFLIEISRGEVSFEGIVIQTDVGIIILVVITDWYYDEKLL